VSVLTLRTDDEVDEAIASLQQQFDESKSAVVRRAILALRRATLRAGVREEAVRLAADPDDRQEARAILDYMGGGDAW